MEIFKRIVLGFIGLILIAALVWLFHFEIVQMIFGVLMIVGSVGYLIYQIGIFIEDVFL